MFIALLGADRSLPHTHAHYQPSAITAGKSCLLDRYVTGIFERQPKNTIGAAFAAKKVRSCVPVWIACTAVQQSNTSLEQSIQLFAWP